MVVSKRWFELLSGEQISLPPFNLNLASFLPQLYLILTYFLLLFNLNLTSASSGISNHGLETTVYRPLVTGRKIFMFLCLFSPDYYEVDILDYCVAC